MGDCVECCVEGRRGEGGYECMWQRVCECVVTVVWVPVGFERHALQVTLKKASRTRKPNLS